MRTVGYDEEVDGDVMGDVMGMGEVVGYENDGTPVVVGRGGGHMMRVHKPGWRQSQMAPGVIAPDQGMLPLPLSGSTGVDTFSASLLNITFQGQLQKPFRGERLLVTTVRTGTSAVGRVKGQVFVGTDLQQADIQAFDIEAVGQAGAFGVRLTMKPAQPGVFIRIVASLSAAVTGTDTIACSVTLLGRIVH
jgi:hypothetical protein